jgi:hypothetical protein
VKSVTRAIVVPEVFVQLVLVPAPGSAAGLLRGAMHIAGSKRVYERLTPKALLGPGRMWQWKSQQARGRLVVQALQRR